MSRMPTNRLPCGHTIQHSDGEGCRLCKEESTPHYLPGLSAKDQALEAVLLFYEAGTWTYTQRQRWRILTGSHEATTKVLCATVRAALGQGES